MKRIQSLALVAIVAATAFLGPSPAQARTIREYITTFGVTKDGQTVTRTSQVTPYATIGTKYTNVIQYCRLGASGSGPNYNAGGDCNAFYFATQLIWYTDGSVVWYTDSATYGQTWFACGLEAGVRLPNLNPWYPCRQSYQQGVRSGFAVKMYTWAKIWPKGSADQSEMDIYTVWHAYICEYADICTHDTPYTIYTHLYVFASGNSVSKVINGL